MTVHTDAGGQPLYDSDRSRADQERAFRGGDVPVAVYGLGKMGLPLAVVYAAVTGRVVGADVDDAVVAQVNRGDCPVAGEPGLPERLADLVDAGALRATSDPRAAAADARLHVVVVPTTLEAPDVPDLSNLEAAVRDVGSALAPGDVVLVESTVPPGTCRDLVVPALAAESGLDPGQFGVAYCPERTSSGRALRDICHSHPKVVGGVDDESTRVAELVYDTVTTNDVLTADAAVAECVKLFEGVYRDVNIALANELARLTDDLGVDVNEAIDVANTQPYCDIHTPGPGVGGHCIPVYPHFLRSAVGVETPLITAAREGNDAMPGYTAAKLAAELEAHGQPLGGATVAVLGVTYRAGVAETRRSPGVDVAAVLADHGATVLVVDPLVDLPAALADRGVEMVSLGDLAARDPDGAVLAAAHDEFATLDWNALEPLVVVDARGALSLDGTRHRVYTIGSGRSGDWGDDPGTARQ